MSKKKGRKKNKPAERAGQDPGSSTNQPFPDSRALERTIFDISRLLEGQDFESEEEASAFLADLLKEGSPPHSKPDTPLERAQEVVYQAFEATGKKRTQLARKALRISEDCADAYVLLAEETARNPEEARELYEKGVAAGERALGQEMFEEEEGNFWGILDTRPYMRARHGLALSSWELGESREAMEHYEDMLRLNPNDNQGIRYLLVIALLEEEAGEALGELLERYEEDASALWLYSRALWMFRKEGATEKANAALEEALETNPFIPLYLLGHRKLLDALPEIISYGDESEAVMYVSETLTVWLRTPGALEWLRENTEATIWAHDAPWDEADEETIAALEAEEEEAVELLREALPELRGVEPPSAELDAASGRLRAGFESGEWPYEHMMLAAGWETDDDLPSDDTELWLGAAGGLASPRLDMDLEFEEEAAIIALETGDWLGAVTGLAHAGIGASASPENLVSYINESPEVETIIDTEDAALVETAFELVLPAWEEAGAVDSEHRLTSLGRWGLPRALAWAWDHDFDSGLPL